MVNRNFSDPDYPKHKKWRDEVKKRDGYRCQFPGCEATEKIEAHHIVPYGQNKEVAWDVANGISLCRPHHMEVDRNEAAYVEMFNKIVAEKEEVNPLFLLLMKRHEGEK